MIFFKKPNQPVGELIQPLAPVDLRWRIMQAIEAELQSTGFTRNREDWFVRARGMHFEDELRIIFDNSKRQLIGVSPICGVSLPEVKKTVNHLLDEHQRSQIAIVQNLGYVSPALATNVAVPELSQILGDYSQPKTFATFWFPVDRAPEPLAIQIARDFKAYGIPFCETFHSYEDVLAFMEKSKLRDPFVQFKKAFIYLIAGQRNVAVKILTNTLRELDQKGIKNISYIASGLELISISSRRSE